MQGFLENKVVRMDIYTQKPIHNTNTNIKHNQKCRTIIKCKKSDI